MSDRTAGLRGYQEANVKPNAEQSKIQREMATGVIEQVRGAIPHAGNVQYTGSNYEGNATRNNSDYDVMIDVAPRGSSFQYEKTGKAGFGKLRYESGADEGYVGKVVTDQGYLSGKDVMQKQVQPAVDRLIGVQNHGGHLNVNGREVDIKRSVHGPAVTLDLKSGQHEAQVDIVPSVGGQHVTGGRSGVDYVAKPSSNPSGGNGEIEWRQSSSMKEKETFKNVHQNNQVHSDVLKTAKTVRAGNSDLSGMPSYVMKVAELSLIDKDRQRVSQGASPKSWTAADAPDRLQDLGKEISKGLEKGDLRHPNNPGVNVLSGTTGEQRQQWKEAIGVDGQRLVDQAREDGNK